jgi:hypothetical protein
MFIAEDFAAGEPEAPKSGRAFNIVVGAMLGALAGAATAIFFTDATCHGATADSFCGLILVVLLPLWAIGGAVIGGLAGGLMGGTVTIRGTEWAASAGGAIAGITASSWYWSAARFNPRVGSQLGILIVVAPFLPTVAGALLFGWGARRFRNVGERADEITKLGPINIPK